MTTINQALGSFLGAIMRICFNLVNNYGLAIILFTLVSKLVLLPVSLWVHNNSIRMVHMQPAINNIKVRFWGDKDRIAEEQHKLYKEEKYNPLASILPLLLQLVLLAGIIEVINHPLTYLFSTPQGITDAFLALSEKLGSINLESSSAQLAVIDLIKNPLFTDNFLSLPSSFPTDSINKAVTDAQDLNMMFLGFNLSWIPNTILGKSIVVPALAGVSAWFLAFVQNKINVLQSEQSNLNKYGMMIFSVVLSLFLGWFVPVGVGVYWISSNLFTIIQTFLLNTFINPKKYIDYVVLNESCIALESLEQLEEKKSFFQRDPNRKQERQDYKRFFSIANKHIVFYSESSGFYKYYKGVLEYLLANTNLSIHYITNDPDDQIFEKAKRIPQIKPYYIGPTRLITLMMKLDVDIVVMTTPDLENYHIKRSYVRKDMEYIYMSHTITSTHMTLQKGSLDHFDTIFCVGQHQIDEIRAMEDVYNLPKKELVPAGYGLLEELIKSYEDMETKPHKDIQVLIAPSWQEDNLLDFCIDDLLASFIGSDYHIIVRPHPEYVKRYPGKMIAFVEKYKDDSTLNLSIESDFFSNASIYSSDILITDWSNIGFEFSYATKKPSLYINTPMKVMNEEYEKIPYAPLDITLRDIVGKSLDLEDVSKVKETVDLLVEHGGHYKEIIEKTVSNYVFALGDSGKIGGTYIIKQLQANS